MLNTPRKNLRYFFGRPVWRNSTRTVRLHPLAYYEPADLKEMELCVRLAIDKDLHVRAVGSGHSFSDAPFTEDILVGMCKLKDVKSYTYGATDPNLLDVQAGITVRCLNKELDKRKRSIRAMGGYDGQTIAGAILTGTHGSSLTFGAISTMVKSVVLVTNDLDRKGEVRSYRIEPTAGITNATSYPKTEPELIQNDAVFHSVVVSFGAMGLVHSLVLEVEPRYYLDEQREVTDWPTVKDRLRKGLLQSGDNIFVQINPYPTTPGGAEEALIMTHHRMDLAELSAWSRSLQDLRWIWGAITSSLRSPTLLLAGHFKITYWWLVYRINRKRSDIGRILRSAIRGQRDRSYKNKAHRVMYQGAAYFKLRAYDSECALPMNDPAHDWIAILDALLVHLRSLHANYRSHLSAPIGLRFVKASPHFLTPEHGHNVCYVDCPVLKHAYGHNNIVGRLQYFFRAHGAIPHWGKRNEVFTHEDIERLYPRLPEWRAQHARFNANGIFSNGFTKRMVGA